MSLTSYRAAPPRANSGWIYEARGRCKRVSAQVGDPGGGREFDVAIEEIDVAPLQIQGPLSEELMIDLVGEEVREVPYYGLMPAEIDGVPVVVSHTGFSGEKGYEVYVRDATQNAEVVWYAIRGKGARYGLSVTAPAHHRRIAAGILSWGQDMDAETSFNLAYQVPRKKAADYIGREELERQRKVIDGGDYPFRPWPAP